MSGRDTMPLVVVTSLFPEPNETFIVRELAALRAKGWNLIILSLRSRPARVADAEALALVPFVAYPGGPARVLADAAATTFRHPARAGRLLARAVIDALRASRTPGVTLKQLGIVPIVLAFARRLPPDVSGIHAHFATLPTVAARMLAAFTRRPYSFTAHAWDIHVPRNTRQLPLRIRDAAFVVTCTRFNEHVLRDVARSATDAAKIHLSYHGLDLRAYVPPTTRSRRLVVGGASLTEKKGLHHLLAACALLRSSDVEFECLLVGQGPQRALLEAQVRACGLENVVTFAGQLPHRVFLERIRNAAVLAHPSIVDQHGSMDGVPNTILEAMAVETPVVASRLSGIPEVVEHERTGLLIEPGDVEALAASIGRLLRDPALARRLGSAGRALVLERFDIERNVETLAQLLEGIIHGAPSATSPGGVAALHTRR